MKVNMQKLEDERILKYCGFINHVQTWLRTHIKFIRPGDRFKIGDEIFLATSDPYWYRPKVKPTFKNMQSAEWLISAPPIEQEPGWSIKFVKE